MIILTKRQFEEELNRRMAEQEEFRWRNERINMIERRIEEMERKLSMSIDANTCVPTKY